MDRDAARRLARFHAADAIAMRFADALRDPRYTYNAEAEAKVKEFFRERIEELKGAGGVGLTGADFDVRVTPDGRVTFKVPARMLDWVMGDDEGGSNG